MHGLMVVRVVIVVMAVLIRRNLLFHESSQNPLSVGARASALFDALHYLSHAVRLGSYAQMLPVAH